jgi:hypothetical protein
LINKNNLNASITIRPSNKMEGQFSLKFLRDNKLSANIRIRNKNSITASLNISPSNRMEGLFQVQPPPRYTKVYSPIKDAFVRSNVPTLNYGSSGELIVGYNSSTNEKFRTFMQFDIADLPKDMIIVSSKLRLNCVDVDAGFNNLEVSTINRMFEEYGVTWNSQPAKSKLANMVNVNAYEGYVDIDLTKTVEGWYADSTSNNGLVLKAFNEAISQLKRFFSRDNRLTPTLEVVYLDPYVPVYSKTSMHSSITVKRQDYKGLKGSIFVNSYYKRADLKASMHVENQKMIEASMTVGRRYVKGSLTIRSRTALPASLFVMYAKTSDLSAKVDISRKFIFGSIHIVKQSSLSSNLIVKRKASSDITASLRIQGNMFKASLYVRDKASFPAWLSVKGKMKSSLSANLVISQRAIKGSLRVVKASSIAGSLYIVRKVENKLRASITVKRLDISDLNANGMVRAMTQMPATMLVNSKYFKCSLIVEVPRESYLNASITRVRATKGILGTIAKVRATNTVYGRMTVKTKWFSDMYVTIDVNGTRRKKKAYVFII